MKTLIIITFAALIITSAITQKPSVVKKQPQHQNQTIYKLTKADAG